MPKLTCPQLFIISLLSFLLTTVLIVGAQESTEDSLTTPIKNIPNKNVTNSILLTTKHYDLAVKTKNKKQQIICLRRLADLYATSRNFKQTHIYIGKGIITATNSNLDTLTGELWNYSGYIYQLESKYDLAIASYVNAQLYCQKIKNKQIVSDIYLNIGICESKLSKFEIANTYYFKAAHLYTQSKDSAYLSTTYNSIGLCYKSLNDNKNALTYHKRALAIRQKLQDKSLIAQSFNNIGYTFKEASQPDSAIYYLSRCMELRKAEKDSSLLVLTLQNLGAAFKTKGNFIKAESYILRSLRIAAAYQMPEEIARGNLDLASLYSAQNKPEKALAAVAVTQHTAQQLKLPELLRDAYSFKYNFYLKQADYKQALFYSNKVTRLNDSLFSIAKSRAISELEIKYQTTQKEKDIAALNAQNTLQSKSAKQQHVIIVVLIVAAVLLLLLFGIAYNSFRIKNKANQRIQTLMQDLHHRVKNNLQILSGLFSMQIDNLSDEATKNALRENEARLTSMNLIHNKLYMDHTTTAIEMNEYLTKLLQHVKGSFGGDKIALRVDVDDIKLEADKAVAIGLIVNELATNAFKYAFDNKPGEIYLQLKQQGKSKIQLTLGDTGKGIEAVHKEKEISFGLKLVNLMTRQLGATMQVESHNGTRYIFEITI